VMAESLQARDEGQWAQAAATALAMNRLKPPLVGASRWANRHDLADFAFASVVRQTDVAVGKGGAGDAAAPHPPPAGASASLMSVRYCVSVENAWVADSPRAVAVLHIRNWSCSDVSVSNLRLHLAALQAHMRGCAGFLSTARMLGVSRVQVSARVQGQHVPAWCGMGLPFTLASTPADGSGHDAPGDAAGGTGLNAGAGATRALASQTRVHVRWVWDV
jgi:hypothetical protein